MSEFEGIRLKFGLPYYMWTYFSPTNGSIIAHSATSPPSHLRRTSSGTPSTSLKR